MHFLMKTLYDLLDVRRQASHIEIELGYRRHLNRHLIGLGRRPLSKRVQQKLQTMRHAYLVLSSPGRRQAYDLDLMQREQRRNRMLDIGGAILAVSSLVIGMGLIVASPYFPDWPDFAEDFSRQFRYVVGAEKAADSASSTASASVLKKPVLAAAR
jgi:curved DNA-binding protein CbpA